MVKVYFESPTYSELVCIFNNEITYMEMLPALEGLMELTRFTRITEVVEETNINEL